MDGYEIHYLTQCRNVIPIPRESVKERLEQLEEECRLKAEWSLQEYFIKAKLEKYSRRSKYIIWGISFILSLLVAKLLMLINVYMLRGAI